MNGDGVTVNPPKAPLPLVGFIEGMNNWNSIGALQQNSDLILDGNSQIFNRPVNNRQTASYYDIVFNYQILKPAPFLAEIWITGYPRTYQAFNLELVTKSIFVESVEILYYIYNPFVFSPPFSPELVGNMYFSKYKSPNSTSVNPYSVAAYCDPDLFAIEQTGIGAQLDKTAATVLIPTNEIINPQDCFLFEMSTYLGGYITQEVTLNYKFV